MAQALAQQTRIAGKVFNTPAIFCYLGKAGSGKSYCLEWMISEFVRAGTFKFGWCFCSTSFSGAYDYMGTHVTPGYNDLFLRRYLHRLHQMRKALGDQMPANFIIFDDLIGHLKADKAHGFQHLITSFRHYNTSIFIGAQYCRGHITDPLVRELIRYVFCWPGSADKNDKNLFDSFGHTVGFKNVKEFGRFLGEVGGGNGQEEDDDEETEQHYKDADHTCLLIDTSKKGIRKACQPWLAPSDFESHELFPAKRAATKAGKVARKAPKTALKARKPAPKSAGFFDSSDDSDSSSDDSVSSVDTAEALRMAVRRR